MADIATIEAKVNAEIKCYTHVNSLLDYFQYTHNHKLKQEEFNSFMRNAKTDKGITYSCLEQVVRDINEYKTKLQLADRPSELYNFLTAPMIPARYMMGYIEKNRNITSDFVKKLSKYSTISLIGYLELILFSCVPFPFIRICTTLWAISSWGLEIVRQLDKNVEEYYMDLFPLYEEKMEINNEVKRKSNFNIFERIEKYFLM